MLVRETSKPQLQRSHTQHGFSLIELIVVMAIIATLTLLATPSIHVKVTRPKVNEAIELGEHFEKYVSLYYSMTGELPSSNSDADIPEADKILGNYVSAVYLEDGALHILLGNKISGKLASKTISLQPLYVQGEPKVPLSWNCGYSEPPPGMMLGGKNKTDIAKEYLPLRCKELIGESD